jgi:RNA polymerase sigma-70 factor (ECF subfamily)
MMDDNLTDFEAHRAHLKGLAYRMLGSVSEAEDAVQDAYLRWHDTARGEIENPRAYLSRVITRLCLDRLKSARHRREIYVGPWLPEPLVADAGMVTMPEEGVARDVSVALMLVLERLSPLERAAFILHDVFDMDFDEVAAALGRSEATCRQLARRARGHVDEARPRFAVAQEDGREIAEAFFAASRSGDAGAIKALLAETAMLHSDGGGRKAAALNLIEGADRISRFFAGLTQKIGSIVPRWSKWTTINGLPGVVTIEYDGTLQTTAFEVEAGQVTAVYVVRNPEKLKHIESIVPPEFRG